MVVLERELKYQLMRQKLLENVTMETTWKEMKEIFEKINSTCPFQEHLTTKQIIEYKEQVLKNLLKDLELMLILHVNNLKNLNKYSEYLPNYDIEYTKKLNSSCNKLKDIMGEKVFEQYYKQQLKNKLNQKINEL